MHFLLANILGFRDFRFTIVRLKDFQVGYYLIITFKSWGLVVPDVSLRGDVCEDKRERVILILKVWQKERQVKEKKRQR